MQLHSSACHARAGSPPRRPVRAQEHSRRAAAFASRLEALGARVTYPGLPSHPQHKLLRAQSNAGYGFGWGTRRRASPPAQQARPFRPLALMRMHAHARFLPVYEVAP